MNQISPDTFEGKRDELTRYLFGEGFLSRTQCAEKGIDYDEKIHKLSDDCIDSDLLKVIAENVFRKAQMEKDYIIFYGKLCEALITRELDLRELDPKVANMKYSKFRTSLFDHCRTCFQKFFEKDEKKKHTEILGKPVDKNGMSAEEREAYNDNFEKAIIF